MKHTVHLLFVSILLYLFSLPAQACQTQNSLCIEVQVMSVENKPLADMVVYIEPLAGQVVPSTQAEISIGQRDKSFTPYISVIQRHQKVSFVNHDDITHHIYSVDSDNKFDFKIKAGKANAEQRFEKSAEIAMGCNIHDWMSGYLLVLDTPYFAKTDSSGTAHISLVQKGRYKVVVWHPQLSSVNNRMEQEAVFEVNTNLALKLQHAMVDIPEQENDDDFEFLSDY